jgi:hypothetical protein
MHYRDGCTAQGVATVAVQHHRRASGCGAEPASRTAEQEILARASGQRTAGQPNVEGTTGLGSQRRQTDRLESSER